MSAWAPPDPSSWPPGYEEENRGPGLLIFTIVLTVISIVSIVGRFWSRAIANLEPGQTQKYWWDDWTALTSLLLILVRFTMLFYMFTIGLGYHADTLPTDDYQLIQQFIFVSYFLYSGAVFFAKESAILFLSRVFPRYASPVWFNVSIIVAHALNGAWFIGIFLANMLMCIPVAKNWDRSLPGYCVRGNDIWIANGATSIFIDLFILIIPLPRLWSLQIKRGRKLGLSIVFALGIGAVVISVGRLITSLTATPSSMQDATYGFVNILYWINAEAPILLLAACLPAMVPLGRNLTRRYVAPLASRFSIYIMSTPRQSSNESDGKRSTRFSKVSDSRDLREEETAELGIVHSWDSHGNHPSFSKAGGFSRCSERAC